MAESYGQSLINTLTRQRNTYLNRCAELEAKLAIAIEELEEFNDGEEYQDNSAQSLLNLLNKH